MAIAQVYLPVNSENSLVLIEDAVLDSSGVQYIPHGTGFLFRQDTTSAVCIITNRHILAGRDSIIVRYNHWNKSQNFYEGIRYNIIMRIGESNLWYSHPDTTIDLAALEVVLNLIVVAVPGDRMKEYDQVRLGDPVIFLGFPLADAAIGDQNYPLARFGIVSFKTIDVIRNKETGEQLVPQKHILLDALVDSGNSGSPVFSVSAGQNEKASFIGVLSSHISSLERLSVPFSKAIGITHYQNIHLGICIPADRVDEVAEGAHTHIHNLVIDKKIPDEFTIARRVKKQP